MQVKLYLNTLFMGSLMHGMGTGKRRKRDIEEAAVKRHLYFAVYRRSANCFRLVSLGIE